MTGRRLATTLGLVLLSTLTLTTPAHAATKTITLSDSGESPASVSVAIGDVVRFVNSGNGSHQVDSGTGWTFHKTVAAGASASTPAFTRAGSFSYTDSYTLLAIPQRGGGTITVAAVKPSPSPAAKPSASPKPSTPAPSPAPRATPSASAPAVPTPTPSATGGTGTALTPGLGVGGILPSATPSATAVPGPDIAAPVPSGSPSPVTDIAYGGKDGIVQGSPHRYGLPALLALVGIVGVLSLIVRFLLAQPEARG